MLAAGSRGHHPAEQRADQSAPGKATLCLNRAEVITLFVGAPVAEEQFGGFGSGIGRPRREPSHISRACISKVLHFRQSEQEGLPSAS